MMLTYQKKLNGDKIGIVFGSFAPLHQGHLDLIMRAKKENDGGCIVIVCGYDGDKGEPLMPHKKRYRYVREFFADDDLVAVYAINDTELGIAKYPNGWEKWLVEFNRIWDFAVENKTAKRNWYVGEKDYYDGLTQRGENAILLDRTENFISATMIRQNPIKHWDKITDCKRCNLRLEDGTTRPYCTTILIGNALDLINRQKAEIVQWRKNCSDLYEEMSERLKAELKIERKLAKTEAVREFAEKIKTEINEALENNYKKRNEHMEKTEHYDDFAIYCNGKIDCLRGLDDFIDNLLKGTVGDDK